MGSVAQLEYVIRGLKRKPQAPKRTRLPISLDMLEGIRRVMAVTPELQGRDDTVGSCHDVFFRVPSSG